MTLRSEFLTKTFRALTLASPERESDTSVLKSLYGGEIPIRTLLINTNLDAKSLKRAQFFKTRLNPGLT